jgi:ATP-dependent RNA helicase RhlE
LNAISFKELNLIEPIQRAIETENYAIPTPIQAAAIPHLLAGRDLLGCAQTGTGKTAAFALPILQLIDQNRQPAAPHGVRALVLSPTRELASQISRSFEVYGRHLHFRQAVVFGGVNQNPQVRALARGVHVLVATPGRLLDLMGQGHVRMDKLTIFVLDEADRMLDMGFLPDLRRIVAQLPSRRQSLFFSATMSARASELASVLLTNPVRISVTPPATTVGRIDQRVFFVERSMKQALLRRLLGVSGVSRALVFTRTKHGADKVARLLGREGLVADAIHGNKSQNMRERTLEKFRRGSVRILVATDLAARGIDVDDVSHVINFDMPLEPESYVHRIGRTGRAGAAGVALSFCDPTERGSLRAIEKLTKQAIAIDGGVPQAAVERPIAGSVNRATNGQGVHRSGNRDSRNSNRRWPAHDRSGARRRAARPGGKGRGSRRYGNGFRQRTADKSEVN